jgi:hypothetical protein
MSKAMAAIVCAAIACSAGPALLLAAPPIELPALVRIAAKLSGLAAKRQVKVVILTPAAMQQQAQKLVDRDYPLDQQAYDEILYRALGLLGAGERLRPALLAQVTQNVLGVYDPVSKSLFVRNGTQIRLTVVHELIHAFQDQAFDLTRLSALRRGNHDAGLAASAAVEGDATYVTEVLGGRILQISAPAVRTPQSHDASRIKLFLGLETEFPYTTGARFMATLHNLGGNSAVFGALRRFPDTTEQIFHIDAYLAHEPALPIELPAAAAGYTLARDDTFGELDIRALLAVMQVPRLDHVGEGWGGGLSAVYRGPAGAQAVALRLDWDTPLDAAQWTEAVQTYVNEAFDPDTPGFPPTTPCGALFCWQIGSRAIAYRQSGVHTVLVIGGAVAAADSISSSLLPS